MVTCKQDMPPSGGYAPIMYKAVPLNRRIGGIGLFSIGCAVTVIGVYQIHCYKNKINLEKIEMRCSNIALRPMLEAENDRMILKQLKRNRDQEEKIMKDVKGWEVGKWQKSPVYLSLGPDEYFKPTELEYLAHTDIGAYKEAAAVLRNY